MDPQGSSRTPKDLHRPPQTIDQTKVDQSRPKRETVGDTWGWSGMVRDIRGQSETFRDCRRQLKTIKNNRRQLGTVGDGLGQSGQLGPVRDG